MDSSDDFLMASIKRFNRAWKTHFLKKTYSFSFKWIHMKFDLNLCFSNFNVYINSLEHLAENVDSDVLVWGWVLKFCISVKHTSDVIINN